MTVKVRLVADRDEALRLVEDIAASNELIALDLLPIATKLSAWSKTLPRRTS
jgi:hypothetical protein